MGIQIMIIAALCIAMSNLFLRRSIDAGGTSKAYLMIQLSLSSLIMVLLNPVRTGNYSWDTPMAIFAILGGFLLAAVMTFMGKALEKGPPGLSIAMLNCSSVMPILFLVILFGSRFGFEYTLWNGIGSLFVIIGICWAGTDGNIGSNRKQWLLFASLAFLAHVGYLVFLDWRALYINHPGESILGFSFGADQASTQWFMPLVFFSAALMQTYIFLKREKRVPKKAEWFNGVAGSVFNGLGAFSMFKATEVATSMEHAMLFPVFAVALTLSVMVWGKWLYKEQIHWKANALSIGGLLIGTVDWSTLFK